MGQNLPDYCIINTHTRRVVADTRESGFLRQLSPTIVCREIDIRAGFIHREHRRRKVEPEYGYAVHRIDEPGMAPFLVGGCGVTAAAALDFVCWIGWD